jgi:IS5 family transposase
MAWKNIIQRSFADDLVITHKAVEELDDAHDLIDWSRIESLLKEIHTKVKGEKAWPPLMMYKALLLQSWYSLGDPALEKQLARDLLFRRFVGLGLSEGVPDHSTFWRFRNLLEELNLYEPLLEEVNLQLGDQGLIIRSGEISIIDASVIKAKNNRPNKDKQGNSTQDKEAAYNVKNASDGKRQTPYGFKAHINVEEDGYIKRYGFTAGNVHDSQVFESLLTKTEHEAYADSAYKSKERDKTLKDRCVENRILERAYRNKPLTEQQKKSNQRISGTRSIVERTFGVLKQHHGMANARYLGLSRNKARLGLMCVAHNLKRAMLIHRATISV